MRSVRAARYAVSTGSSYHIVGADEVSSPTGMIT
jgi:hypothetical protein